MNTPRMDVRNTGAKALFDWLTTSVQAAAQEHLCRTGEKMTPAEKAVEKAQLLVHRTNWPLPVAHPWKERYTVLSSDGVTHYTVERATIEQPWTCTCPAHGPCWHIAYVRRFMYVSVDLDNAHLPIDFARQDERDGMPVRTPAGKARLFHDEAA